MLGKQTFCFMKPWVPQRGLSNAWWQGKEWPAWPASSSTTNQLNLLSCQSAEPPQLPNQLNCFNCQSAELPQQPNQLNKQQTGFHSRRVTGTCAARDRLELGIPNPELRNRKGQPSNRGTPKFLQQVKKTCCYLQVKDPAVRAGRWAGSRLGLRPCWASVGHAAKLHGNAASMSVFWCFQRGCVLRNVSLRDFVIVGTSDLHTMPPGNVMIQDHSCTCSCPLTETSSCRAWLHSVSLSTALTASELLLPCPLFSTTLAPNLIRCTLLWWVGRGQTLEFHLLWKYFFPHDIKSKMLNQTRDLEAS